MIIVIIVAAEDEEKWRTRMTTNLVGIKIFTECDKFDIEKVLLENYWLLWYEHVVRYGRLVWPVELILL